MRSLAVLALLLAVAMSPAAAANPNTAVVGVFFDSADCDSVVSVDTPLPMFMAGLSSSGACAPFIGNGVEHSLQLQCSADGLSAELRVFDSSDCSGVVSANVSSNATQAPMQCLQGVYTRPNWFPSLPFSARIACQSDVPLAKQAAQATLYTDAACSAPAASVPLYTQPLGSCASGSGGRTSSSVYCDADGSAMYAYQHSGESCSEDSWFVAQSTLAGECLAMGEVGASVSASLRDNSPFFVKYSCPTGATPQPLTSWPPGPEDEVVLIHSCTDSACVGTCAVTGAERLGECGVSGFSANGQASYSFSTPRLIGASGGPRFLAQTYHPSCNDSSLVLGVEVQRVDLLLACQPQGEPSSHWRSGYTSLPAKPSAAATQQSLPDTVFASWATKQDCSGDWTFASYTPSDTCVSGRYGDEGFLRVSANASAVEMTLFSDSACSRGNETKQQVEVSDACVAQEGMGTMASSVHSARWASQWDLVALHPTQSPPQRTGRARRAHGQRADASRTQRTRSAPRAIRMLTEA